MWSDGASYSHLVRAKKAYVCGSFDLCLQAVTANHWPLAIEYHLTNHPCTQHSCQDLHQADWGEVPKHDLMLASPACQGHSRSRGKERLIHDKQRNTAWAVVSCAEYHRQEFIIVENVVEFKKWLLFPSWVDAIKRLGYAIADFIIDAADNGVPQHRKRLFLVLTKSKHPIKLKLPKYQRQPVSSIIEWNSHRWNPINKPGRSLNRHETRHKGSERCYAHEMLDSDHENLLRTIRRVQGFVVLSGYDNDIYNDYLIGWQKQHKMAAADGRGKRTEVIWIKVPSANERMRLGAYKTHNTRVKKQESKIIAAIKEASDQVIRITKTNIANIAGISREQLTV